MYYNKTQESIDKLKTLSADLKAKKLKPFYFFYGEETYFISKLTSNIKSAFSDLTGINTKLYTRDNFDVYEVSKYLETLPVMNDKKLIIFNDIDYFRRNTDNGKNDQFINVLNRSKDINIVIIILNEDNDRYEKNFSTNKFLKLCSDNGEVYNSIYFDEPNLVKYVINYVDRFHYKIDRCDAEYIVRICNKSIASLYLELDKIMSYIGNPQKIKKQDIDDIVLKSNEETVFNLIDFVNDNNLNSAYKLFGNIINDNINEIAILSIFSKYYEELLMVKDLTEQSKTLVEITTMIGYPATMSWKVKKMVDANKGLSKDTIKRRLSNITKLTVDNFYGNIDKSNIIEILFN